MKRVVLFAALALMLSGCAVTSESYRYRTRFNDFYSLLNDQEKAWLAGDKLDELGASLDSRSASDPDLAAELYDVRVHEAITTFDGKETAYFFRHIILRELNRPNYYKLMDMLSNADIQAFANGNGFPAILAAKEASDRKFARFVNSLQKEYGLYDYTDQQLYDFFRTVIFPEETQKQVYYLCDVLKKSFLLKPFLAGDIPAVASQLSQKFQGAAGLTVKRAWQELRGYSGLTHTDTATFLTLYHDVVMKEMDADALKETLQKFGE